MTITTPQQGGIGLDGLDRDHIFWLTRSKMARNQHFIDFFAKWAENGDAKRELQCIGAESDGYFAA